MDAIRLLKQDHKTVEALFKRFEAAGDRAFKAKRSLAEQIIKELSIHASIEEQFLYPAARERNEALKDQVLEALEEHHLAKATLSELDKMNPQDERFDAKMTVLMENVRHHVEEEQGELFPKLEKVMGKDELEALGAAMEQAKSAAPTHPHPMSPDTPPGNFITDALAKVLDSGMDMAREVGLSAQRVAARTLRKGAPKLKLRRM